MTTTPKRPKAASRYSPLVPMDGSLPHLLRETHRALVQALAKPLAEYDVSFGMWYFLRALWEEDGLAQTDLCDRVGASGPTTVEQMRHMEVRGLIRRNRSETDRRRIHVFLTAEGKALRRTLLGVATSVHDAAFQGLNESDLGHVKRVLDVVRRNLSENAQTETDARSGKSTL